MNKKLIIIFILVCCICISISAGIVYYTKIIGNNLQIDDTETN